MAHTARLHRETVAGFDAGAMVELPVAEALVEEGRESLQDRLMPADAALTEMPAVHVDADAEVRFREGQVVSATGVAVPGLVRVYGPAGQQDFLGVGEFAAGGAVAPKRVFARP